MKTRRIKWILAGPKTTEVGIVKKEDKIGRFSFEVATESLSFYSILLLLLRVYCMNGTSFCM